MIIDAIFYKQKYDAQTNLLEIGSGNLKMRDW